MGKVNSLNRRLYWKVEIENHNKNQKLIRNTRKKDKEIVRVVEKIKKARVKILRDEEWQIDRVGIKRRKGLYKELRVEIIWLYHDVPVVKYGET